MTSDKRMSGLGLLVLRLVLGVVFLAHGAHEVFGMFGGPGNGPGGLSATSAILGAAGLPQPFLIAVTQGIIELVAGAMLVAGFFTRTASFLLLVFVTAGLWKLRWPWGFFMNWTSAPERGHGMEYGIVIAAALICLLLTGPGDASIDGMNQQNAARRAAGKARLRGKV
jgi:putative oxidoreductase